MFHGAAWSTFLLMLAMLASCASAPRFDTDGINQALTPQSAAAQASGDMGNRVIWGGTIVAAHNETQYTELEVLAYPLDGSQRPRLGQRPEGRFRARWNGYLETADYAPGRQLTVKGSLLAPVAGTVGEAGYVFPVVAAEQLELWSQAPASGGRPNVHFGIGVVIGN
jgi:outer membrane lipoprotein